MKRGFTLLELIIVVIILGILVSIAIPTLSGPRRRAYSAEALNILGAMRGGQIRYYEQSGNVYLANGTCTGLDTTVGTPNYNTSPVCLDDAAKLVTIADDRTDTDYCLAISAAGVVSCTGADCVNIGYVNTAGACP